jgi:uncharacterized protein YraI
MKWIAIFGLLAALSISSTAAAQNELAAALEVLSGGVEMKRVNTSNWIAIRVEAVVGVGDVLRTDASGRARITFFADGTETELLPGTEYRINRFEGSADRFNFNAEVLVGQTIQRLSRLLDANSSYDITTPAMSLVARGTEFAVRVEENGRSAMLVREGEVEADAESASAAVPPGFGVRAAIGEPLSDVVRASTFAELDAALDGCAAVLTTPDDVSLNVRSGASTSAERIGYIDASSVTRLFGVTSSGSWYRIAFDGGFGWVLSSSAEIAAGCAGLRVFPDNFREGMSTQPTPAPTSAPSATPPARS